MTVALIARGATFEKSARLIGRMWAKAMLLSKWNMSGQNTPIFSPGAWSAAAANRQRPPAIEKIEPMIILPSSSGSQPRAERQRQKAATATSIEKERAALTVTSQVVGAV